MFTYVNICFCINIQQVYLCKQKVYTQSNKFYIQYNFNYIEYNGIRINFPKKKKKKQGGTGNEISEKKVKR